MLHTYTNIQGGITRIFAVTVATIVILMLNAQVASADGTYSDRVDGSGPVYDDFYDIRSEAGSSLCRWWSCRDISRSTNLAILWQSILYVDDKDGDYPLSEIDGYFGSNTERETKEWQRDHGITADGYVGAQTWATANRQIQGESDGGLRYVIYEGRGTTSKGNRQLYLVRKTVHEFLADGQYYLDSIRWDNTSSKWCWGGDRRIWYKSETVSNGGAPVWCK